MAGGRTRVVGRVVRVPEPPVTLEDPEPEPRIFTLPARHAPGDTQLGVMPTPIRRGTTPELAATHTKES